MKHNSNEVQKTVTLWIEFLRRIDRKKILSNTYIFCIPNTTEDKDKDPKYRQKDKLPTMEGQLGKSISDQTESYDS